MCEFKIGDRFMRLPDENNSLTAVATIIDGGRVKFRFLHSLEQYRTDGHFHFRIIAPDRILNPSTNSEWVYLEPFEADLLFSTVNL